MLAAAAVTHAPSHTRAHRAQTVQERLLLLSASRGHASELAALVSACGGGAAASSFLCERGLDALTLCARAGVAEAFRALIDAGVRRHASVRRVSPAAMAAFNGHVDVLRECLAEGREWLREDMNVRGAAGAVEYNVWHIAAAGGHASIIDLLAAYAVPGMNERDWTGSTPLMIASGHGRTHAITSLLAAGCVVRPREREGSALHDACLGPTYFWRPEFAFHPDGELGRLFRPPSAAVSSAVIPGADEYRDALCVLLSSPDIDVDAADALGQTPLLNACRSAHVDAVRCVLEAGASPSSVTRRGETVFDCLLSDWMLSDKHVDSLCKCIDALLSAGADAAPALRILDQSPDDDTSGALVKQRYLRRFVLLRRRWHARKAALFLRHSRASQDGLGLGLVQSPKRPAVSPRSHAGAEWLQFGGVSPRKRE